MRYTGGLQAVREADAMVVCMGFGSPGATWTDYGAFKEGEGWDRSYTLPARQGRLISELAKLNPPADSGNPEKIPHAA